MGTDIEQGCVTEHYEMSLPSGEYKTINKEDIIFYSGVLIRNRPYPVKQVTVEEAEEESCSECGVSSPCTVMISEATEFEQEVRVCNHCLVHMGTVYGHSASVELCQSCPKEDCCYSPRNPSNVLSLPPGPSCQYSDM